MPDISVHTRQKFLILSAFDEAGKSVPSLAGFDIMEKLGQRHFGDKDAGFKGTHLEGAIDDLLFADFLNCSKTGIAITQSGRETLARMGERYFPSLV